MQLDLDLADKAAIAMETKKGEEEAMRVAIDERRRVKAIAEEKKSREISDAEFAKATILDEIDAQNKLYDLCSKDDEFAKEVRFLIQ